MTLKSLFERFLVSKNAARWHLCQPVVDQQVVSEDPFRLYSQDLKNEMFFFSFVFKRPHQYRFTV